MPVIGRLDKQVEEVLIDPVGSRRRRNETDERAPADAARREEPRPLHDDASQPRLDDTSHTRRDDAALPVWLL